MIEMNCETCQKRLVDLLDFATNCDGAEFETLKTHLRECEACSEIANELVEAFSLPGFAETPADVPFGFEDRVFEKIEARRTKKTVSQPESPASQPILLKWVSWGLAAALLIGVVGGQWLHLKRIEKAGLASRDPSEAERMASLERAVEEMRALQQQSQRPEIRFVSFQPQGDFVIEGAKPTVAAHAVWDALAGQIHFFGFDIVPPLAGQTYALWYEVDGVSRLAKSFTVGEEGVANFVIDTFDASGNAAMPDRIVVSVEQLPVGGVPSESVWLVAEIN